MNNKFSNRLFNLTNSRSKDLHLNSKYLLNAIYGVYTNCVVKSDVEIKQLVSDYSRGNIEDQSASISSTQLIVTNQDKSQLTYVLPKDEFFVSIAPYIEQTHPCATHSLTGCQGELGNEEFEVYLEDSDGNVIRNEKLTSNSNGFIDLWLPRDKKYSVSITQDGKTMKSKFSTFESDDTCITTMQLT